MFKKLHDWLIGLVLTKTEVRKLINDVAEAERAAACEMAKRFETDYRRRGEIERAEAARYLFNALHARIGTYDYGCALLKHWRELGADL